LPTAKERINEVFIKRCPENKNFIKNPSLFNDFLKEERSRERLKKVGVDNLL